MICLIAPQVIDCRRAGGAGAWEIRGQETGEEKAGSGSSKRAESGREMRHANYFNLTMR